MRDPTREDWLAARKHVLTATDIAAILDGKGLAVWLDKKNLADPLEQSEPMKRGLQLQPIILNIYEEELEQPLIRYDNVLTVSRTVPIVGASLDAQWARGDKRPVDAKNVGLYMRRFWGEAGTDDIPRHIRIQMHVQMHVTDTEIADVAALFGGNAFARFTVRRDKELEEIILEQAGEWWERHIVRDVPPEMDGEARTTKWLAKRFEKSTGVMIPPSPEHVALVKRINRIDQFVKRLDVERTRCANILREAIGEADGIDGIATYKFDKPSTKLDEKAYIQALEELACNLGVAPDALKVVRDTFTAPKPPVRRFIPKEVK